MSATPDEEPDEDVRGGPPGTTARIALGVLLVIALISMATLLGQVGALPAAGDAAGAVRLLTALSVAGAVVAFAVVVVNGGARGDGPTARRPAQRQAATVSAGLAGILTVAVVVVVLAQAAAGAETSVATSTFGVFAGVPLVGVLILALRTRTALRTLVTTTTEDGTSPSHSTG